MQQNLKRLIAARGDRSRVRRYGTGEPATRWTSGPGETPLMKRLIAILALSTALGVAACGNPNGNDAETAEGTMDAPTAPTAEDAGVPVAAPGAAAAPPADSTTLPPEKQSSEESVRPESETLFY
jgi:hypothetical protein